ncbi:hypothetical protein MAPG_09339 [Magnaporthiopsis poae ATCC 64411]|uniref:Phospholipase/carboxylesterase/thioesterase domain-containing protein n=1 Tax=Magnaporthiopsis poae (strain ATCC 64411 / 73-15) TaxID=644358 RepID=A0A0C4E9P3_MAGP6|nr:hypothetical protein MAPG_09339 [Magnaporthiopsis poae ATCC 64411]
MEDVSRHIGPTRLLALKDSLELRISSVLDEGARAHFRNTIASPKHRHFLGLYPAAEIHLGCDGSNAWDVTPPPANQLDAPPRRILWGGTLTTGVSYGIPGLFGLNMAWLVPEAAVMLHMIQAYLHCNLRQHAIKGDLFKDLSKVFRVMRDRVYTSRKGAPLSFHSFSSNTALSGVVFVEAWELLGARDECAGAGKGDKGKEILVFFGHFEHEPMRPAAPWPCRTWFTVPSDREYLVASLQCLKRMQSPNRPMEFLLGHYWIPSSRNPFQCHGTNCNMLQRLVTGRQARTTDFAGWLRRDRRRRVRERLRPEPHALRSGGSNWEDTFVAPWEIVTYPLCHEQWTEPFYHEDETKCQSPVGLPGHGGRHVRVAAVLRPTPGAARIVEGAIFLWPWRRGSGGPGDPFKRDEEAGAEADPARAAVEWLGNLKEGDADGEEAPLLFRMVLVFPGHGVPDDRVNVSLGREATACLAGLDVRVVSKEYETLGHWYSGEMLHDIVDFVSSPRVG